MAAVNMYHHNFGVANRVTSYALNPIMSSKVELTFHTNRLSKRMKTMLINQFKRGYQISYSRGQLATLTNILSDRFNLIFLPVLMQKRFDCAFYNKTPSFIKHLTLLKLLHPEVRVKEHNTTYPWHTDNYVPMVVSAESNNLDMNPKQLNDSILDYLNEFPGDMWNSMESRQEVVDFLKSEKPLIANYSYK